MSRALIDLHPDLRPLAEKFLSACMAHGFPAIITDTWRSDAEQNAAYDAGKSHARAGESPHNHMLPDGTPASLAFDFLLKDSDGHIIQNGTDWRYTEAGHIGGALGLEWGGRWPKPKTDYDHLQMPNWKNYDAATHNID